MVTSTAFYESVDELVAATVKGDQEIAIPSEFSDFFSAAPVAIACEVVKQSIRGIRILAVPTNGLVADILIGCGCATSVEAGAVVLREVGTPPQFRQAAISKAISVLDSTCPAIFAALTAAERGIPYMPVAGILGSDLIALHDDWTIDQGSSRLNRTPCLTVNRRSPDLAIFHSPRADICGNVWVGRRREIAMTAHAAQATAVTVDEIVEHSLMDIDDGIGVLPNVYVDAICEARGGSWPMGSPGDHDFQAPTVLRYAEQARTSEGLFHFVDELRQRFEGTDAHVER